jgi:hypothetical protein
MAAAAIIGSLKIVSHFENGRFDELLAEGTEKMGLAASRVPEGQDVFLPV